jgi:hypothetical protein
MSCYTNYSSPVRTLRLRYQNSDVNSESNGKISLPYPPDIKSFLYYFTRPEKPRIAAELCLRVTSSGVPTSFESGSDLLKPNGRPWSRPLCVLPRYYNPLYKKLREDRLVPDDLDAFLSTSISKLPKYRGNQLLYTLNDTFIVDFSYTKLHLFVITEQSIEMLLFRGLFYEGCRMILPYTGAYTNHHLSILLD